MGSFASSPKDTDRLSFKGDENELEELDRQILKTWWRKMGEGHFRYGLEETRVVMLGEFVGNLNPKRATKRVCHEEKERIPIPVSKPFKPNGFHFMKVKEAEVMFIFRDGELRPFQSFEEVTEDDHLVIINVNPVGAGHTLLVPFAKRQQRQFLMKEYLEIGLQFLQAMGPTHRLLFNSIGGFGSVNHLHFQLYFTKSPERIESIPLSPSSVKSISLFDDWTRGLCVEFESVEEGVDLIIPLVETMQTMNVAHNIFFRKGKAFVYPRVNELSNFNQSIHLEFALQQLNDDRSIIKLMD